MSEMLHLQLHAGQEQGNLAPSRNSMVKGSEAGMGTDIFS